MYKWFKRCVKTEQKRTKPKSQLLSRIFNLSLFFTARCYVERGYAMASCPSARLPVCGVVVSWSYSFVFL